MVNSTSLFHFVNLALYGQHISTVFIIIGTLISFHSKTNLKKIDHWLYGLCDNNTDTEGISHLISYNFFNKSACLKKFYNSHTKKYYEKGNPNFQYPAISHGSFNDNNKFYNFFLEKCKNDTIGEILGEGFNCKNEEEINQYFDNLGEPKVFQFYFLNNYINISSYYIPITKFFYRLESPFYQKHYTVNNLNINPSKIVTNDGVIFDSANEKETYIFERNDVNTIDKDNEDFYVPIGATAIVPDLNAPFSKGIIFLH